MAELTKAHLWINTGIAACAFLASAASAFYAFSTYSLKSKSLAFSALPTEDCRVEYQKAPDGGTLGLCWLVTITNQSDRRTSIISHQAFELDARGRIYRSGFTDIEERAPATTAVFPIILDFGEAKNYIFRIPVSVPQSIAKLIDDASSKNASSGRHITFSDLSHAAFDAGLDLLGTSVNVHRYSPDTFSVSYDNGVRQVFGQMKLMTGRGTEFNCNVSFPPLPG